jgi:hypothetical protein
VVGAENCLERAGFDCWNSVVEFHGASVLAPRSVTIVSSVATIAKPDSIGTPPRFPSKASSGSKQSGGASTAPWAVMKYLALLLAVAGIYFYFARQTPVAEVAKTVTGQEVAQATPAPSQASPPQTSGLRRPIDRTREVLGQASRRNAE